jgi:hypothetical protein
MKIKPLIPLTSRYLVCNIAQNAVVIFDFDTDEPVATVIYNLKTFEIYQDGIRIEVIIDPSNLDSYLLSILG